MKWQGGALDYSDIDTMAQSGLSIQSHSRTHPRFNLLQSELSPADYAARLKDEMEGSRDFLRDKLKRVPTAFAYPYGVYNAEAVKAVRAAGYRMAFTVNPGPNDRTTDPFFLHRELVMRDTTHRQFESFFAARVLHLSHLVPADGDVIMTRKPVFSTRILDDVDPKSVKMYLGDRPLTDVQYNPKTGRLRRALKIFLHRGGHLVTVTAVDRRGILRSFSWYFRIYKPPKNAKSKFPPRAIRQLQPNGKGVAAQPTATRAVP